MGKLNISQKSPGNGPFIDDATATELAKEWIMSNRNRRRNMAQEYDLMPLLSKVRGGEIKIGVVSDLQQKPKSIIPGLDMQGNLIFLRGYPNTKMFGPRDFYDTRKKKNQKESFVNEERQYQLRAANKDGKEDVSEWYDDEDSVYEMKKQIDELEDFEKLYGAKGLAWIKIEEGEINSPFNKKLSCMKEFSDVWLLIKLCFLRFWNKYIKSVFV
mgnify:CR=1 FL=1